MQSRGCQVFIESEYIDDLAIDKIYWDTSVSFANIRLGLAHEVAVGGCMRAEHRNVFRLLCFLALVIEATVL